MPEQSIAMKMTRGYAIYRKRRANRPRALARKKAKKYASNKLNKLPLGLPDRQVMQLRYTSLANEVTTSAGVPNTYYRFSLNNLIDPDVSGGGAQCPLFDNMTLLYGAWRVKSVLATVRIENWTNFPTAVTMYGLFDPTTNSPSNLASSSNYDLMALNPRIRSKRHYLSQASSGNSNVVEFSKRFDPKDLIGENYLTDVNYAGLAASAPTSQAVIDIAFQTLGVTSSPAIGCFLTWVLTYDVEFYDRKEAETAAYD